MKKINIYGCTKGHETVTRLFDQGNTPVAVQCQTPGCGARAVSRWFNVDQSLVPSHEWYIPTVEERGKLPRILQQQVLNGGLILRPIPQEKSQTKINLINRAGSVDDIRCSLRFPQKLESLEASLIDEQEKQEPRRTVIRMLKAAIKRTSKTQLS